MRVANCMCISFWHEQKFHIPFSEGLFVVTTMAFNIPELFRGISSYIFVMCYLQVSLLVIKTPMYKYD